MEPALPLLQDHFQRAFLAARLKPPPGVFEALVSRYREPARAYHTLQHIGEGIALLKTVRAAPPSVAIAWWFHDAIYDPRRQDNEEKSAAWAEAVLQGPLAAEVKRLILATKHDAPPADGPARLLVDIDLAGLAATEPRYSEIQSQIRQEYGFVDDETWRRERLKFLRRFTDRAFIYMTPEFRNLETKARKNLERTINAMITGKRS